MNKPYQESTFSTTETGSDPLEALARQGAKQWLPAALEAEVTDYLPRRPGRAGRASRARAPRGARRGRVAGAHGDPRPRRGSDQSAARER